MTNELSMMDAPEGLVDPLSELLSFQLRCASVAANNGLMEALEPLGVRMSEALMLQFIAANPGITQVAVGRAMRIKPANIVPIVNRLMASDLLVRERGEGRAFALFLSAAGEQMLASVREVQSAHEARISRLLPPEKREEFLMMLHNVCRSACCDDLEC